MFLKEEINKTALMILTELMLKDLITKIGQRAKCINELIINVLFISKNKCIINTIFFE
jgi:hypothetical protein